MAKPRKNVRSNRKRGEGRRALLPLALAAVLLLIVVGSLVYFTNSRKEVNRQLPGNGKAAHLPAREQHRLPVREQDKEPVHEDYTAVVPPPPTPRSERHPLPASTGPGTLAIIIDDMGKGVQEARSLSDIGVPVTFSIIPGLAKVKQVAEEAHRRGIEVMVHMPMEPKGYPAQKIEGNGLLLGESDEEIVSRLNAYLRELPRAVGANNHMGSAFTENREKMAVVLGVLKERGLFFVDSKTSPVSVGYDVARAQGVRTAARNVFLDNIQERGYIAKQLAQAISIARKRGSAIAICHPHPATIQTLAAELPRLRDEGITFVPVSQLVR
ncbi:divergent polysaccharide deacetylase family protein [Geobacter pickeringii]|uniref:Sugar deacetylase n=1 Tax=Geobacter pickeringii TaxID=345632 RepID=A0A0B5BDH3_9BACT|nr:divergent polysaccharide deacetylase family protein [Geobacter pickeringii]AJE03179.1 sugar deacetylase [Geobacter pickeringii]